MRRADGLRQMRLMLVWVGMLFCSLAQAAPPGDCGLSGTEYPGMRELVREMVTLKNRGCYGEAQDATPWVAQLGAQLDVLAKDDVDSMLPRLSEALAWVDRQLAMEPELPALQRLGRNIAPLLRYLPAPSDADSAPGLRLDNWRYDSREQAITLGDGSPVTLKSLLGAACEGQPVDWSRCEPAVRNTERVLRYGGAVSRIVWTYHKPNGQQTLQELSVLDARWQAYYYHARPQNVLELAVNSWRFHTETSGQAGFISPPDYQWIVLHPNLAMEYVANAPDGSAWRESLMLELFGQNRWRWQGARMGRAFGWSVVASYSDRAGVADAGWGLMAHVNHIYSFGVTRRGDDNGVFLSVDLLRLFPGWSDTDKQRFVKRR